MENEQKKLRRYLVFGYYDYYPCGGLDDVHSSHDTLQEAQVEARTFYGDEPRYWNIEFIWDRIDDVMYKIEP